MLKKIALLLGIAGVAVIIKQKLAAKNDSKDLWAQAADKPADNAS
ncbi:DLW-39 family protein [Flexivirga caeni]|nr:DLW-39 family protein [Flexivirga caeni]